MILEVWLCIGSDCGCEFEGKGCEIGCLVIGEVICGILGSGLLIESMIDGMGVEDVMEIVVDVVGVLDMVDLVMFVDLDG